MERNLRFLESPKHVTASVEVVAEQATGRAILTSRLYMLRTTNSISAYLCESLVKVRKQLFIVCTLMRM
jgi:hypothetical protein